MCANPNSFSVVTSSRAGVELAIAGTGALWPDRTVAAALTVAAVGAAGVVEWPVLLPVDGTVLAVHYPTRRSRDERNNASTRRVGSRSAAKGRSGSRASKTHMAARSRSARSPR
jgi:hypothetical protein